MFVLMSRNRSTSTQRQNIQFKHHPQHVCMSEKTNMSAVMSRWGLKAKKVISELMRLSSVHGFS